MKRLSFKLLCLLTISLGLWSSARAYVLWNFKQGSFPVHFKVNTANEKAPSLEAIRAAARTWSQVPGTTQSFIYDGETTESGTNYFDRLTTVSWADLVALNAGDRNRLAVTICADLGSRVDCDIILNTNAFPKYVWTNDPNLPIPFGHRIDIESVVLHEMGHVLGLWHSQVPEAVMYDPSMLRRTLAADDLAAVRFLYPGPGTTNHPPVLSAPANVSVQEGKLLSFVISATDQDGDPVTLGTGSALPEGATFTPRSGEFQWTPNAEQGPNSYPVIFTATDSRDTARQTTNINVADINQPPVWFSVPSTQTIRVGEDWSFELKAVDPDILNGNSESISIQVIFSNGSLPSGIVIDPPTVQTPFTVRTVHWRPTSNQVGEYVMYAIAIDSRGAQSQIEIPILVRISADGVAPDKPKRLRLEP